MRSANLQAPSFEELVQCLHDLTHELSNSVGNASGILTVYIRKQNQEFVPEPILQAANLASTATGTLRTLMWKLQWLELSQDKGK